MLSVMTIAKYNPAGNYPAYVVDADVEHQKTVYGPWIRVPPGARSAFFEYKLTDTNSPVGTLSIDISNEAQPGDTDGIAVAAVGATSPDGDGAKHDHVAYDFHKDDNVVPQFIRAKYVSTSGGEDDTLNIFARVA